MPTRNGVKDRAWGTRYDTLGSWAESSPPSPVPPLHSPSNIPHNKATSVAPPPTPAHTTFDNDLSTNIIPNTTDKMPHDASIFVGSLPSHIEHTELTRLLSEHLSEYADVKNVKVVRDNKGGVCAFVQCQDAPSATRLIETLQSQPPRPFIGRYLRFEPARAFRTLLVSYRAPTQYVRTKPALDGSPSGIGPEDGHIVALDPATALRIFRPHQSKYLAILYNDEARNFDVQSAVCADTNKTMDDPFIGQGTFLFPLNYDAEAIRTLAAAFGSIEHFGEFKTVIDDAQSDDMPERDRIHPHDAPRSANMATQIWEIKWKHREDCVSALMTLRRIPHITVTWAHHQCNASVFDSRLSSSNVSPVPRFGPSSSPQRARNQLHPYSMSSLSDYQRINDVRASLSHGCTTEIASASLRITPSLVAPASFPGDNGFVHSTPFIRGPPSPLVTRGSTLPPQTGHTAEQAELAVSPKWLESDFPPLHGAPAFSISRQFTSHSSTCDPRSDDGSESLASPSPSSSLSVQPATPVPSNMNEVNADVEPEESIEQSLSSPSLSLRRHYESEQGCQELTVPPTPDYTVSSLTPVTPGSARSFPCTPQSANHEISHVEVADGMHGSPYTTTPKKKAGPEEDISYGHRLDASKQFDLFTIFVGGLEMFGPNAWDDIKLRHVFGKYGEIADVQIVRPLTKKSAFAFVRFKLPDVGVRAVAGEHNRVYDGYQVRVQLRENNPHRSPFRYARGRGRVPHISPEHAATGHSSTTSQSPVGALSNTAESAYSLSRTDSQGPMTPGHSHLSRQNGTDAVGGTPTFPFSVLPGGNHSLPSPDTPSMSRESRPQYDTLRANSASTAASISPSPSALGHPHPHLTMGGTVAQYPLPVTMGYYHPNQQWMHPYHPYPYAFPFMPGYVPFSQAPHGTSIPDASGYVSASQSSWAAVGDAYKQSSTATHDQFQTHGHPQHTTQPPLHPTGFIQGDQGTLIPVYQPDALDRYMSTNTNRQADTPSAQPSNQPTAMWHQYPQIPMYPYIYHPPSMVPSPSHQLPSSATTTGQGSGWIPTVTPAPFGPQQAQYPPIAQPYVPMGAPVIPQNTSGSFRHSITGIGHVQPHQHGVRQVATPRRYQRQYNRNGGAPTRLFKTVSAGPTFDSYGNASSQRPGGLIMGTNALLAGQM